MAEQQMPKQEQKELNLRVNGILVNGTVHHHLVNLAEPPVLVLEAQELALELVPNVFHWEDSVEQQDLEREEHPVLALVD